MIGSSTVIQRLQLLSRPIWTKPKQPASATIIYFYFNFRNTEQQHTAGMLYSLLYQLTNSLTHVPEEISGMWEKCKGKRTRPSPDELLLFLVYIVQHYVTKVFVIPDALDECSECNILLPVLIHLMENESVSLFLTGRSERDIQQALGPLPIYSATIESSAVAADVELFVKKQIQILGAKGIPKAIRHALNCLPKTLDESYNRILLSIQSDEEREILRRTLQFVVFAARPMKLKEVVEAVGIEDDNTKLDPDDRFNNPEHLIKNLRSLLITIGGYLRLFCYSIQEYLQSLRIA
ncbi:hypothetical protein G7Y89_g10848 [Cudoniella acicularis]|uniref:Nephrocystin 3-like N-terminal domain-containing protein n=1 Tax=Cudoniella acicularis TaxID=354080 RepID=A0A8H4REA8_9HELO|nr:hypothetical protein G7Y89_g10848 [Cudoniella acicularis]